MYRFMNKNKLTEDNFKWVSAVRILKTDHNSKLEKNIQRK